MNIAKNYGINIDMYAVAVGEYLLYNGTEERARAAGDASARARAGGCYSNALPPANPTSTRINFSRTVHLRRFYIRCRSSFSSVPKHRRRRITKQSKIILLKWEERKEMPFLQQNLFSQTCSEMWALL